MIVVGFIVVPIFAAWERYTSYPIIPTRYLKNRTVVIAALIGLFDFVGQRLLFHSHIPLTVRFSDLLLPHISVPVLVYLGCSAMVSLGT